MADNSFTHLVVVGSSAGGIGALSGLVSSLPDDFDAPVVVAQHLDPNRESHLQAENGLVPALQDLLEVAVPDDVNAVLSTSGAESRLSDHQRGQLYLILREAVRNAVRHSGCRCLTVGLDITSEEVSGYVEDDGCGFEDNGETLGGLGLRSIRERAALLQGTPEMYSSPEGGAGVRVRLPLLNGGG